MVRWNQSHFSGFWWFNSFIQMLATSVFFVGFLLLPLVRVVTSFTVGMFFDIWYTLDLGCCRHVKSIVYLHGWIVISDDFVDPKFESTCRWLFPNILLCSPPSMERWSNLTSRFFQLDWNHLTSFIHPQSPSCFFPKNTYKVVRVFLRIKSSANIYSKIIQ